MPAVPTNFTRHDADSTLANHEDRALRRVSHNIYNDNRSTRNVGSIRTGPNVLERAALFGGATTASSKTTSRRSRYDTLAETDDTPTSLPSSRFLNSAYSSSSSSSTSSTVAANTTNTAATLYVDENLQKEIIKENPKHIDDKLNANVASYTSINNTMKGTVKKWLIRGAAVVTQGSSAATVSKRDNTVRRGPVASLLPRDHRQSINLHDIDAILDMGDDTVAEVASSSASASPLKIANVSAARAVWTAFEEEAKSKIYSSENTKRKETFIDATAISSEVYVPASWLPLSSPVKQSNLSVKNNDKQHESSANPNTNSDHASNSLTKPQTTTSPVILNLTPTAIALHENEYRMTPTKELSRPVILQPSTFLLSPKRELASTDTKELSTAMLKMPKQEKSVNELPLPSQSTTQSIQSFNENTNNNSNKVIALDKNAVDSASLPIESSKIPPQRPSRLHIPVMETKPFTSKVSSTKMTLKSTSIHPSPLKDTNESPIEHNQRTLRRIDRIQPRLLNSTEDKADPVMELNTDTCSSPTDINSHSVPKPWLLDEDVQWNERDAEGLRRNSASDIQSRPIIQVNGDSNLSVKNEHRDKLEHEKHEEGADMYHTIHSGYDSDDTILRPPLMRSRSIHRPVQGGLTRKKTTRLARRGSLASTLSGSDRDTLKYTTMKPYYSPLIKDQMTATVTNSGTAASSPSLAQSWMDLEINSVLKAHWLW
ncbi:hypothetical protein BDF19DRAFT_47137 [Syncephalis fuscata]|nr:hypothetical protein BDF19DRAFT_47137 [Syncephalis fuscata]